MLYNVGPALKYRRKLNFKESKLIFMYSKTFVSDWLCPLHVKHEICELKIEFFV